MTVTTETRGPARGETRNGFWRGRSGLVLAVLVLAVAIYLTVGIRTMRVPESAESPGPTFFPTILAVACYALSIGVVVHYLRHPTAPEETEGVESVEQDAHRMFTDWRSLGLTMGAFLLFVLLLNPVGWILSAALMFWVIAFAMGSRSAVRDVAVALIVSCSIQVAFSAGLGLHLPAGVLEGVL